MPNLIEEQLDIDFNEFQDDDIEEAKRTTNDVYSELDIALNQIKIFANTMNVTNAISIRRTYNYLSWLNLKTKLIINESNLIIPKSILPQSVNSYLYNKFNEDEIELINEYYVKKSLGNDEFEFILNSAKDINSINVRKLVNFLVIKRTAVVWIDFGFNIGREFGGKHPALILKNIGDNIIVVPLSSKKPKEVKGFHVRVNKVMKFNKKKTRWINIHRIIPVSINRIDFDSVIGSVRGDVLDDISEAIKSFGIR